MSTPKKGTRLRREAIRGNNRRPSRARMSKAVSTVLKSCFARPIIRRMMNARPIATMPKSHIDQKSDAGSAL